MSIVKKFEYKTATNWYDKFSDEKLNEYGAEGWELVGFAVTRYGHHVYVFKREKYD